MLYITVNGMLIGYWFKSVCTDLYLDLQHGSCGLVVLLEHLVGFWREKYRALDENSEFKCILHTVISWCSVIVFILSCENKEVRNLGNIAHVFSLDFFNSWGYTEVQTQRPPCIHGKYFDTQNHINQNNACF